MIDQLFNGLTQSYSENTWSNKAPAEMHIILRPSTSNTEWTALQHRGFIGQRRLRQARLWLQKQLLDLG